MSGISDASGQCIATCFDDEIARRLEDTAREGGCGLLTVELDKRPGEDTPRVTIKTIQPFDQLANSAKLVLDLAISDTAVLPVLASLLADQRGGQGQVRLHTPIVRGETEIVLGSDFRIDGELAERIENLQGVEWAVLKTAEIKRLRAAG